MIRRLYILVILAASVVASYLYLWEYAHDPLTPVTDPVRRGIEKLDAGTPDFVTEFIKLAISETEARIYDLRWSFLILFAAFYLQFFLKKRAKPAPSSTTTGDLRARRRGSKLLSQMRIFLVATFLVALAFFGIEFLCRMPAESLTIWGYEIRRGNAELFRHHVYHYGLVLAVGHMLAYMAFTWLMLKLAARRARKRASTKSTSVTSAAAATPSAPDAVDQ